MFEKGNSLFREYVLRFGVTFLGLLTHGYRPLLVFLWALFAAPVLQAQDSVIELAVFGVSHGHVGWLNDHARWDGAKLVGIVETDSVLAKRVVGDLELPPAAVYGSLADLLEAHPGVAGVLAFGNTFSHLEATEFCAPRGIHLMVEKPLAVNLKHARRMEVLAWEHGTQLLTNYETSWMSGVRATVASARSGALGEVRRLVFRTGHMGPRALGLTEEFLEWLTDPVLNGGGAVTDFGCYGVNLATWVFSGQEPATVSCHLENLQPVTYPDVDDAATIVLTYPDAAQVIIQASWNWPHHVKDMDVYGADGYALNFQRDSLVLRENDRDRWLVAPPIAAPHRTPFEYFTAVIRGEHQPKPYHPYSLENNMTVMRVLEAAKQSARRGKVIRP